MIFGWQMLSGPKKLDEHVLFLCAEIPPRDRLMIAV